MLQYSYKQNPPTYIFWTIGRQFVTVRQIHVKYTGTVIGYYFTRKGISKI